MRRSSGGRQRITPGTSRRWAPTRTVRVRSCSARTRCLIPAQPPARDSCVLSEGDPRASRGPTHFAVEGGLRCLGGEHATPSRRAGSTLLGPRRELSRQFTQGNGGRTSICAFRQAGVVSSFERALLRRGRASARVAGRGSACDRIIPLDWRPGLAPFSGWGSAPPSKEGATHGSSTFRQGCRRDGCELGDRKGYGPGALPLRRSTDPRGPLRPKARDPRGRAWPGSARRADRRDGRLRGRPDDRRDPEALLQGRRALRQCGALRAGRGGGGGPGSLGEDGGRERERGLAIDPGGPAAHDRAGHG